MSCIPLGTIPQRNSVPVFRRRARGLRLVPSHGHPASIPACAAPYWRRFLALPPEQPEIVTNDKPHASLLQHVCSVCDKVLDTVAILLDKCLRASMGHYTATGSGLRPEIRSCPMTASPRWSSAICNAAIRGQANEAQAGVPNRKAGPSVD